MIFATGLSAPEGPVALPDGTWLIVEGGAERGCVTHVSADGQVKRVIKKTGRPNGLAVDSQGVIWVAESKTPSLVRLTMDGKAEVVATNCDGEAFLFPNDLCFGPDGAIYLTDSGVVIDDFAPNNQIRPDYMDVRYDGRVYRVDVEAGKVTKMDSGIKFTNGIAFGPDRLLYANETLTGNIYRYDRKDGEIAGPRDPVRKRDPAGRGPRMERTGRDGLRNRWPAVCRSIRAGRCYRAGQERRGRRAHSNRRQTPDQRGFRAAGTKTDSRHGV